MELAEVDQVHSTSRAGASIVQVTLREDLTSTQVDQAWTLVRDQASLAEQSFPTGVTSPDIARQYIGAATMIVSVTWDDAREDSMGVLTRIARDLEDQFQALTGTEETQVYGAAEEEIRVVIDDGKLTALGLTAGDVARLAAAADVKAPAGTVRDGGVSLNVEIAGELDSLQRVRETVLVSGAEGASVRIGDVAQVEKGVRDPAASIALVDGRRTVFVAAFLQPGLRVDQWTRGAESLVETFRDELPRGVTIDVEFAQDKYVEQRLSGLAGNLMMSALIVFGVLFVMMGWRAAFIVGSALPLTVGLVLILIKLTGEPLHQMSVTGLVIALGLLIDNAIVMVDEYRIKRRKGATALEAVNGAVRHLFAPLTASTLTTMLAFAPIALMPGAAGEFVGMIGVSVMFAVGSSLVLALTVIPAFAAWFDAEPDADGRHKFWRDGLSVPGLTRVYRASIRFIARRPWAGIGASVILPVVGFVAASQLPMQFFPPTDRDMFQLELLLSPDASIDATRAEVDRATAIVEAYDGVEEVSWVIGTAPPRTYYNVLGGRSGQPSFAAGWVRTSSERATRDIVPILQAELRREFPGARFLALPFEQGPADRGADRARHRRLRLQRPVADRRRGARSPRSIGKRHLHNRRPAARSAGGAGGGGRSGGAVGGPKSVGCCQHGARALGRRGRRQRP